MEKRAFVSGGCSRCEKSYGSSSMPLIKRRIIQKVNIELSYDSAIPLRGIYPRDESREPSRYVHTAFPAVLLTKAWGDWSHQSPAQSRASTSTCHVLSPHSLKFHNTQRKRRGSCCLFKYLNDLLWEITHLSQDGKQSQSNIFPQKWRPWRADRLGAKPGFLHQVYASQMLFDRKKKCFKVRRAF